MRTVIVFTGGDPIDPSLAASLPDAAFVIAADSGIEQAVAIGRHIDLAVGDFDSVGREALERVVASGTRVERHPMAKDATDLELGLLAAATEGATDVVVVGGHGGRVDHFLANALLLTSPAFARMRIEAHIGQARIVVVHDRAQLRGAPGDIVSLLPVGGPAIGVRTAGLRFPLHGEDLQPGTSRGVSNELVESVATVEVDQGTLLVVQPGRT